MLKTIMSLEASHCPDVVHGTKKHKATTSKVVGAGKGAKKPLALSDNSEDMSLLQIKHHKKKSPPTLAKDEAFVNNAIDNVMTTTLGHVVQVENEYHGGGQRHCQHI